MMIAFEGRTSKFGRVTDQTTRNRKSAVAIFNKEDRL